MGRPGTCELPYTATGGAGWGYRHCQPQAIEFARPSMERHGEHETASNPWGPQANP